MKLPQFQLPKIGYSIYFVTAFVMYVIGYERVIPKSRSEAICSAIFWIGMPYLLIKNDFKSPSTESLAYYYYNRGLAKSNLEDKYGAIADYTEALKINRNWGTASAADTYNNRGIIKILLGDTNGAIDDFSESILINNTNSIAYYNRGLAKAKLLDYQSVISDLNEAIRINRNWTTTVSIIDAFYNRGVAKMGLGDKEKSISDLRIAMQLSQAQGDDSIYQNASKIIEEMGKSP